MAETGQQIFDAIQDRIDAESERREQLHQEVKALDRACRSANAILNRVHANPEQLAQTIADQVEESLAGIRTHIQKLANLLPEHRFFKYNDMWSRNTQQACFLAATVIYLRHERLITTEEMSNMLQVPMDMSHTMTDFHLTVEDYLHALCSLVSELSRLAINAVTAGDLARPFRVSAFTKELHASFQLLNLKNDTLRKRFDGIKYDVKRVEEVVYDLTLRGLKPKQDT